MEEEHMEYCVSFASIESKEMGWWVLGEVESREKIGYFLYRWEKSQHTNDRVTEENEEMMI